MLSAMARSPLQKLETLSAKPMDGEQQSEVSRTAQPRILTRPARRRFFSQTLALGAGAATQLGCSPEVAPKGRQTATLWFTYGGKNREVLLELVARFNASQSRFFIRPIFQGDYFEGLAKLRTALAAGVAPALSHVIGEVIPYLAEANVLEPLSAYPEANSLGLIDELSQVKTWHGHLGQDLVCLPFNRSTPIAYVNADVFEKERLEAPKTWDELRSIAQRLTQRQGNSVSRFGFSCPINWWFWVALVFQAGGDLTGEGGRVTLGNAAGVRALEFWQTLVNVDGSMRPPPGRDYNAWEQTNRDFLAGRAAMIWTSTAFLKYLEENAPFRVKAAPLPADLRHAAPSGGTFFVMLRQAPQREKDAAWAFLLFMHEPRQAIDWATRTGYLPVTHAAVEKLEREGYYEKHPNDRVAYDQLGAVMPWPWSKRLFRLQREIVQPRLEAAVLEHQNAREVLDEARALAQRSG
jgi:sn-glycerol 3-phosphate transport system substrate-binding protein